MKKLLIPAALAALSMQAVADSYQVELLGQYIDNEIGSLETDILVAGGTFYIEAVDDSKGPLAEAAFLNKASSISVAYTDIEMEQGPFEAEGDSWALGGRAVVGSGFIIDAAYSSGDIEGFDIKAFTLGGGMYLSDSASLVLSYTNIDDDFFGETDIVDLDYKNLLTLGNGANMNIDATLGYSDPDAGDSVVNVGLGADYYINSQLSLGGSLGFISSDDTDAWSYGVRAEYFFNSHVAIAAAYDVIDFDDFSDDDETLTLSLTGRF